MTTNVYHRPAMLPSEAVMLPAMDDGTNATQPPVRAALQAVRCNKTSMQAMQQQREAEPTMWLDTQAASLHNEETAAWLGGAALRTVSHAMPSVHVSMMQPTTPAMERIEMDTALCTQPAFEAEEAVPQQQPMHGVLRGLLAQMMSGRSNMQPLSFRPLSMEESSQQPTRHNHRTASPAFTSAEPLMPPMPRPMQSSSRRASRQANGCNNMPQQDCGCNSMPRQDCGCNSMPRQNCGCSDMPRQDCGCNSMPRQNCGCSDMPRQDCGCNNMPRQDCGCSDMPRQDCGCSDMPRQDCGCNGARDHDTNDVSTPSSKETQEA